MPCTTRCKGQTITPPRRACKNCALKYSIFCYHHQNQSRESKFGSLQSDETRNFLKDLESLTKKSLFQSAESKKTLLRNIQQMKNRMKKSLLPLKNDIIMSISEFDTNVKPERHNTIMRLLYQYPSIKKIYDNAQKKDYFYTNYAERKKETMKERQKVPPRRIKKE